MSSSKRRLPHARRSRRGRFRPRSSSNNPRCGEGDVTRITTARRAPRRLLLRCAVIAAIASGVVVARTGFGQTAYRSGQDITPAFDGWEANPDGTFNLAFGYFNRNWDEELDIPIGPNNNVEPGGPDQGQPTHFYPR